MRGGDLRLHILSQVALTIGAHWSPLESMRGGDLRQHVLSRVALAIGAHWSPLEPIGGHGRWRFETACLERILPLSLKNLYVSLEAIGGVEVVVVPKNFSARQFFSLEKKFVC